MSEPVVNGIETKRSFQVNNPAMAAMFTPFLAITPMFVILFREVTSMWKIIFGIGYVLFIGLMVALAVWLAKKSVSFVLGTNQIQIDKREYAASSMDQVRYNKKTKYVQLNLKSGNNPSMHLQDQQDEEQFIDELKQWTDHQGIKFTIIDKRKK